MCRENLYLLPSPPASLVTSILLAGREYFYLSEQKKVAALIVRVLSNLDVMLSAPVNRRRLPQRDELLAPYNLGYRIKRLSQLLSRQLQERLEPFGLTPFHWVSNIALAAETTQTKTTQAQGDITGAVANIDTAKAAVAEAQAGIPTAQAAVAEAEAGIPAAQAQVAQADANLQKAQTDYNRYNSLFQQGAVPRQQLDAAKAAYDVASDQKSVAQQGVQQAQARLAQAQQGVARAQSQLAQAQEGVAAAQAKLAASKGGLQQATASGQQTQVNRAQYEAAKSAIAQAEASLKDAQLQLSYTNIYAPSGGRIGRKTVEVGQRVQPGSPLMAIVEGDYWITANFKETQLEDVKPGQEVEIKLDAFPHHTFTGRVDSISPASGSQFALLPPDNATGNFTKVVQRIPVKVIFDSQSIQGYESRITPRMSAAVGVVHK